MKFAGTKFAKKSTRFNLLTIKTMKPSLEMPTPVMEPLAGPDARRKILLVDDDPAIRPVLLHLLSEEGFLVRTAASGGEARELSDAMEFDLVLLDLNLPDQDGWEIFEQLSSKNPLMPVILITARPNQLFPAQAAGGGALLEKPLDFVKLLATVYKLLDEPAQARLARYTGRPATFRHIPPKSDSPAEESASD
jgi:DNA-binding response OmpR family regulator